MLLPVAEDIPAGRTDLLTLKPGTAHRIMTGAPLPAGATAVVPVEATDGATDTVSIRASAAAGQHVRRAGEDVDSGHHGAAGRSAAHPGVAWPGRRAGPGRAESGSAATGPGDVDRFGAGGPSHAPAARPDLRVERGDAGRGRPRRRRRSGRRTDDRRRRRDVSRRADPPCRRCRPDHHQRRGQCRGV